MEPQKSQSRAKLRKRTGGEIERVRELLREYYRSNPGSGTKQNVPYVMAQLGLSARDEIIVQSVRKELCLIQPATTVASASQSDQVKLEAVREATELVGSHTCLLQMLQLVQRAGGIESVKSVLHQHYKDSTI